MRCQVWIQDVAVNQVLHDDGGRITRDREPRAETVARVVSNDVVLQEWLARIKYKNPRSVVNGLIVLDDILCQGCLQTSLRYAEQDDPSPSRQVVA